MQSFTNQLTLSSVFDNLKRPKHVLIVLIDPNGNYLLGSKPKFYPNGIFRFAGGGVDKGESIRNAAIREFGEELGIHPNTKKLKKIAQITTTGTYQNDTYTNDTYLFEYRLDPSEKIQAGDDIEDLVEFSPIQLKDLITKYKGLKTNDWYIEDGKQIHSWQDYGKMYGFIHQVALELTTN